MRQAWWLNAALAAVVAALGLFVVLKPGAPDPAGQALTTLKAGEVRTIRIERPGAAAIALERKGDDWRMTAPLAARADLIRVQRLLAVTDARSAHRLAATDLARFELERPEARLTIDGQSFAFGMVHPVSREQYVLTGDAVYTVGFRYAAALPGKPGDLIDKRLLDSGAAPVRVELKEFTVARDDTRWTLVPPGGELSQDDFQRWMDEWRHAAALRVEPHTGGKPMAEVRLQFRNGEKLALGVLARKPELALLRPDEKLVYYFPGASGQRLLSPPAARDEPAAGK